MKFIVTLEGTGPVIEANSAQEAFNQWHSMTTEEKVASIDRIEVWSKEDYENEESGTDLGPKAEYELG